MKPIAELLLCFCHLLEETFLFMGVVHFLFCAHEGATDEL